MISSPIHSKPTHDVTATAPGRLEFIGNHTDYNGGLVMGVAIDRGVTVAASRRQDARIVLRSSSIEGVVESNLSQPLRALEGSVSWANYTLGVLDQLLQGGMKVPNGFDMMVSSDLPHGAGMSSSAALELASGLALGALYDYKLSTAEWARLARRAENTFVGVPCGILDQGVSAFGQKNHLVRIDCRKETFDLVPLPKNWHFWVFNSGVKHALVDSLYTTRHHECAEALTILRRRHPELVSLAAATPSQIKASRDDLGDVLTRRALHVSEETLRVSAMEQALASNRSDVAGEILLASHRSSRDLFENSCPELDNLVEMLAGAPGVFGCRLTGGGFGGAVMAVTSPDFNESTAAALAEEYRCRHGHLPAVFHTQSGDGARLMSD